MIKPDYSNAIVSAMFLSFVGAIFWASHESTEPIFSKPEVAVEKQPSKTRNHPTKEQAYPLHFEENSESSGLPKQLDPLSPLYIYSQPMIGPGSAGATGTGTGVGF